jgi:anti-sigma regulatory factor (Ser/Thr protein kinase)
VTAGSGPGAFVHEALFYRDLEAYLQGCLRFLREGLSRSEPALVAVPGQNLECLRSGLGTDATGVRFLDMSEAGRNPGRIIPGVLRAFVSTHPDGRVRIIGEPIWAGRSAAEYPSCVQHEALINLAFAGTTAAILCPYDSARLGGKALADARRTHPVLVERDTRAPSPDYGDPGPLADASQLPLSEPPEWWGDMLVFRSAADLRGLRRFVRDLAIRGGLSRDRAADLSLAADAVATNTIEHTGAPGVLSIWQQDGSIVCEIADSGRITDRLVGRSQPGPHQSRGRGLLLVNALCDLVQLPTGGLTAGTTVRMHMRIS